MDSERREPLRKGTKLEGYTIHHCRGCSEYHLYYDATDYQGENWIYCELYPYALAQVGVLTRNFLTQTLPQTKELEPYIEKNRGKGYFVASTPSLKSLRSLMEDRDQWGKVRAFPTLRELLTFVVDCLSLLMPLHQKGYIHGEVTPDTLYYNLHTGEVQLMDFLSAFPKTTPALRLPRQKKDYIPPELLQNQQEGRIGDGSDSYSVLSLLFTLLYEKSFSLLSHIVKRKQSIFPMGERWEISPKLLSPYLNATTKPLVDALLYKGLKHRYGQDEQLLFALETLLQEVGE